MPRLKKRADGRYQRRKVINGKSVMFYGRSLAEIDEKITNYELRVNHPATFKEIAEDWKDAKWDSLSVTTQRGYRKAYERAVEYFGHRLVAEISVPDVNRYLSNFIDHKFALKTVQAQKSVISTIYAHAILNGKATQNPARGFELPRHLPKTPRTAPSDEDIRKVATGDYEWLLPRILIYTGMRRGEVLALDWSDIDRNKKTITINKVIVYDGNRPILEHRTKTEAGNRTIPLPDALARYLPPNSRGRLFDYKYHTLCKKWREWSKALGVDCTMHQLRHAYASLLLDAGVTAKDAQVVLGHSDVSVTQNIYTHILQTREQKTAAALNDYLTTFLTTTNP